MKTLKIDLCEHAHLVFTISCYEAANTWLMYLPNWDWINYLTALYVAAKSRRKLIRYLIRENINEAMARTSMKG